GLGRRVAHDHLDQLVVVRTLVRHRGDEGGPPGVVSDDQDIAQQQVVGLGAHAVGGFVPALRLLVDAASGEPQSHGDWNSDENSAPDSELHLVLLEWWLTTNPRTRVPARPRRLAPRC